MICSPRSRSSLNKLRVLIVNDSPTMCASLRTCLAFSQDVDVVGEVRDGAGALDAVVALRPDVVLMDVVMPGFDGYEATRAIMSSAPTPVVMVTAGVDTKNEHVIFKALGAGALSIAPAPPSPTSPGYRLASATLVQLLRSMSQANLTARKDLPAPRATVRASSHVGQLRAIGVVASAGGPPAIMTLLQQLSTGRLPPILIVQHMTRGFVPGFSAWLAGAGGFPVRIARHGEALLPQHVYLAPDDRHIGITADGTAVVSTDPANGLFRPSGDFLLTSLARAYGSKAAGVVLSGMGNDGAAGAATLAKAGSVVITEAAESAAVDGMPRAVRESVPGVRILHLHAIPEFILSLAGE
jgi:two-component system, chemotaxis family, protein-glutamate methylesterase/glutaminase